MLHCIVCVALHCIAICLRCIALCCVALHCLRCIALHRIALCCVCIALRCVCFALHCIVLHCIAVTLHYISVTLHYITLQNIHIFRYKLIVDACCLSPDLAVLVDGDSTAIGERGLTLSGGQKQRISLARALYSDREIYLLDDPLSSVDPDVADKLFSQIIQQILVSKTVILVTHQLKVSTDTGMVSNRLNINNI